MSFNFNDQCTSEHLDAVQRTIDLCRSKNDKDGLKRWILYRGMIERKCGIVTRSCEGCSPLTKALNPCKSCTVTEPARTMIGLEEFELVKNTNNEIVGMKAIEEPPKLTPPNTYVEPECMMQLRANELARQKKENP